MRSSGPIGERDPGRRHPCNAVGQHADCAGSFSRTPDRVHNSSPTPPYRADLVVPFRSRRRPCSKACRWHKAVVEHTARRLSALIEKRSTLLVGRVNSALSTVLPDKIVCCSQCGAREHISMGFNESKICVIPNGFDVHAFTVDANARQTVRREFDIPSDAAVVGHVGRYHTVKDHRSFVEAARPSARRCRKCITCCAATALIGVMPELAVQIRDAGMERWFRVIGHRGDLPWLNNAFDVATSCSVTEGFSNSVGEAMACGVPCVVTDVGDSAYLVGDTGRVVPTPNPPSAF